MESCRSYLHSVITPKPAAVYKPIFMKLTEGNLAAFNKHNADMFWKFKKEMKKSGKMNFAPTTYFTADNFLDQMQPLSWNDDALADRAKLKRGSEEVEDLPRPMMTKIAKIHHQTDNNDEVLADSQSKHDSSCARGSPSAGDTTLKFGDS